MTGFKQWKQSQFSHWNRLSLQRQSGWLIGLIALGATMTTTSATATVPAFWQGLMSGIWGSGTAVLIALLAVIQFRARKR